MLPSVRWRRGVPGGAVGPVRVDPSFGGAAGPVRVDPSFGGVAGPVRVDPSFGGDAGSVRVDPSLVVVLAQFELISALVVLPEAQ